MCVAICCSPPARNRLQTANRQRGSVARPEISKPHTASEARPCLDQASQQRAPYHVASCQDSGTYRFQRYSRTSAIKQGRSPYPAFLAPETRLLPTVHAAYGMQAHGSSLVQARDKASSLLVTVNPYFLLTYWYRIRYSPFLTAVTKSAGRTRVGLAWPPVHLLGAAPAPTATL